MNDDSLEDSHEDSHEAAHPTRRAALALAGRAAAGACVLGVLGGCEVVELRGVGGGPLTTSLDFDLAQAPYTALASPLALVPVDVGPRRILLVALSDTEIVCFDRICTHQGCDLSLDQSGLLDREIDELVCRCHGGSFTLRGEARSRPVTTSLKSWPVTFDPATGKGKVSFT